MLVAHQLTKHYHLTRLFEQVSFTINAGERVGLIGPNGCGKSTLLRLLVGTEAPDDGHVQRVPPDLRLGYLSQGLSSELDDPLGATLAKLPGTQPAAEADLARLATALAHTPDDATLQSDYDAALHRLNHSVDEATRTQMLDTLALTGLDPALTLRQLSGGQQTRLGLAMACLNQPDLLLLDEPTNHLDVDMLAWLEDWLAGFRGAVLIVSHDRAFLDSTVTRILAMEGEPATVRSYSGNYSDYLAQVISQREQHMAAWRQQEAEIRRIRQDITDTRNQAMRVEQSTTPRSPGVRKIAKKVMAKATAREKKLARFLASDERVEKPKQGWQLKLEFDAPAMGKQVLHTTGLAVGYDGVPLLSDLRLDLRAGQRVALVGPNGSGKTTLLRTLAGNLPAVGGEVWWAPSARLGYMSQMQVALDPEASAVATVQAVAPMNETETRNYLHFFLFGGDEALKPVKQLSYGQRSRLALARLVAMGCNVLLLDEPVNHLDIPSRTQFETALAQFEGTVLAVVHDRYFIARYASDIWRVSEGTVVVE